MHKLYYMQDLKSLYNVLYLQIYNKTEEFIGNIDNKYSVYIQAIFCLCTPQSDAHKSWSAANEVTGYKYNENEIAGILKNKGVRFHKTKAKRIYNFIQQYSKDNFYSKILNLAINKSQHTIRLTLKNEINGWGLKETSHFLRNIGVGLDLCILDRHILRRLNDYKVIDSIPKLTNKNYYEIENKMKAFAREQNLPIHSLDMLFWYQSKGEIFQ